MFCDNCGFELEDNAKFCPKCGSKVKAKKAGKHKNMFLAMFLTFIFAGLGVIYAGNVKKGLILAAARIVLPLLGVIHGIFSFLAFIVWIYSFYETYREVKIANGETPDFIEDCKSLSTAKKVVIIIFILFILFVATFISFYPSNDYYSSDYSSSDSSDYSLSSGSGGSSGGSHSSHYGGVDDSPGRIAHDDPDWYYEHYEYGDDYDIDDYLESEGYE